MTFDDCFETARLVARPWRAEDVEQAFLMYSDPEIVRYIGAEAVPSLAQMGLQLKAMIERYGTFPRGMGGFAAVERSSGEVVGNLLLKPLPDVEGQLTADIEIGWHLRRSHWGLGLATEGGRGLMQYGFEELGLDVLHVVVEPPNARSLAVARRLGFKPHGLTRKYYRGLEIEWFSLEREAWLAAPQS